MNGLFSVIVQENEGKLIKTLYLSVEAELVLRKLTNVVEIRRFDSLIEARRFKDE